MRKIRFYTVDEWSQLVNKTDIKRMQENIERYSSKPLITRERLIVIKRAMSLIEIQLICDLNDLNYEVILENLKKHRKLYVVKTHYYDAQKRPLMQMYRVFNKLSRKRKKAICGQF